jgi:hypothetical protein
LAEDTVHLMEAGKGGREREREREREEVARVPISPSRAHLQ